MLHARPTAALATGVFAAALALSGCGTGSSATPTATRGTATQSAATTPAAATPVATATPEAVPSAPSSSIMFETPVPTPDASHMPTSAPIRTPIPGSTLDPSLSDAGVAGRITIPDDTRDPNNNHTGTSEILGLADDGSECDYSLDGTEFTAVAWYDAAPNGMLHQMAVAVGTDYVPANDGEQRMGVTNGSVYADFVSESGFGTAYGGALSKEDGSSSSIDVQLNGTTLVFTFSATTWDGIAFSGQMMCTNMGGVLGPNN